MTYYTCTAVEELIDAYRKEDGHVYELAEGTLGYGLMVLTAYGYKTAVVTEVALSEWSSGHKVRFYETCPNKYAELVYEKYGVLLGKYIPVGMTTAQYLGLKLMTPRL